MVNEQKIIFLRHLETEGNLPHKELGIRFLGRLDYPIVAPNQEAVEKVKGEISECTLFLSSPLKRCRQTLQLLTEQDIINNPDLLEINYGDIDGLYLKQAQEKYPHLFEAWKRGEDPKFPNGENSQDVLNRYLSFLRSLSSYSDDNIAVCTHNVFLRTAVGYSLGIPMKDWFKLSISYFEPIYFSLKEDHADYRGTEEQKKRMLKNLN